VVNFNPWQNFKHFDIWPPSPSSFRSIRTLVQYSMARRLRSSS